ncbi:MAG: RsmD family RNA methyltransferase [Planctomycetota bacterium]
MLRITAGEHRGRRLRVPEVESTRPLLERARQALMDHLRPGIPEARVWDVCAGSGILGFEALSRGAGSVVAVERHPRAVARLRESARELGYGERVEVLRLDARRFLERDPPPPAPDIVFFDPPFAAFRGAGRAQSWQTFLDLAARLRPGGCAVVHLPAGELASSEKEKLPGLEVRAYGSSRLAWWHRPEET